MRLLIRLVESLAASIRLLACVSVARVGDLRPVSRLSRYLRQKKEEQRGKTDGWWLPAFRSRLNVQRFNGGRALIQRDERETSFDVNYWYSRGGRMITNERDEDSEKIGGLRGDYLRLLINRKRERERPYRSEIPTSVACNFCV